MLTGFTSSMHYFSPSNKSKTQFLPHSSRFFYLTFANTNKRQQSDEIRHSSFTSSKPHDVESTDMHWILTTNKNICTGDNTTRRKNCQIFACLDLVLFLNSLEWSSRAKLSYKLMNSCPPPTSSRGWPTS